MDELHPYIQERCSCIIPLRQSGSVQMEFGMFLIFFIGVHCLPRADVVLPELCLSSGS